MRGKDVTLYGTSGRGNGLHVDCMVANVRGTWLEGRGWGFLPLELHGGASGELVVWCW